MSGKLLNAELVSDSTKLFIIPNEEKQQFKQKIYKYSKNSKLWKFYTKSFLAAIKFYKAADYFFQSTRDIYLIGN